MPLSGYRKPATGIPVSDLAIGPFGKLTTGRYYITTGQRDTGTGIASNGQLRLAPWILPNAATISRIGAEVGIVGDAGSKFRIGIYADDGNGYPGALIVDAGTINGDSATVQEITLSQALPAGLLWIGGAGQIISVTPPTMRGVSVPAISVAIGTTGIPAANETRIGYQITGVTGALPSPFTAGGTAVAANNIARVFVKVA